MDDLAEGTGSQSASAWKSGSAFDNLTISSRSSLVRERLPLRLFLHRKPRRMDRSTNPTPPPAATPTMSAVRDLVGDEVGMEVVGLGSGDRYVISPLLMIVVGDPETVVTIVLTARVADVIELSVVLDERAERSPEDDADFDVVLDERVNEELSPNLR